MARAYARCILGLAFAAHVACDGHPSPIAPQLVPAPGAQIIPAIRGLVRETNGGPIAGARVRVTQTGAEVFSDAAGVFHFPAAACGPGQKFFVVSSAQQWFTDPAGKVPDCVGASDSSEVAVELKGQARLRVSLDTPMQIILSDDDVSWIDPDGYACGPCKLLAWDPPLPLPVELRVDWSTDDPLKVWIEGDDFFQTVRLGEFLAPSGEHGVNIVMPTAWSKYDGFAIKVGLPAGSLTKDVAIHVTVRAAGH